ncbi:MAG: lipoprotein insertase outer membrane protein LolB [Gammaproteobacteria bacterium]|nr:lipoprotein insertase outer membrane protein LolB [Gammaproteobacteria bacterium]
MKRTLASIAGLLVLTLLTTACVPIWQQRSAIETATLWQQRQTALLKLEKWQIKGRTVIRQGNEAWNAGLNWQQKHDHFKIKLSGPFAQGGVILDGDSNHVVLTMDDGSQMVAQTPEALLMEALNVHMPVSALRDWVRGLPYAMNSIDDVQYDDQGRISYLKQGVWQIEYLRYVPFKQYSMPAKVFINHPKLSVRVIVDDWDAVE